VHPTTHAVWRKSRHSGTGSNCVEVASLPTKVGVRDSKNPAGGVLLVPRAAWRMFADKVKAGEFDL